MNISYFLGANSRSGFYSLYDAFPPGENSFLHIIKGGPGNGKSRFMRRIGAAAESHGLDVEYVLCSGDPDSLDGVYIPALNTAWCDGTAPHVVEPHIFAVTSDYVNLGAFCRQALNSEDSRHIAFLNREYKELYKKAYGYLSAAAYIRDTSALPELGKSASAHLQRILCRMLDATPSSSDSAVRRHCFFSALSCKGLIKLGDSLASLYPRLYSLPDCIAPSFMELALRESESRGLAFIVSPEPLDPGRISALALPGCSLAFVPESWAVPGAQALELEGLELPASPQLPEQYAPAISQAILLLSQAKSLHDQLEAVYKPYMDFQALDAFTRAHIQTYVEKPLEAAASDG